MALAAMVLATVTSGAFGADSKPAEPAMTTSTTDRLKAKKEGPGRFVGAQGGRDARHQARGESQAGW